MQFLRRKQYDDVSDVTYATLNWHITVQRKATCIYKILTAGYVCQRKKKNIYIYIERERGGAVKVNDIYEVLHCGENTDVGHLGCEATG